MKEQKFSFNGRKAGRAIFGACVILVCCAFNSIPRIGEMVEISEFLHARSKADFRNSETDVLYTLAKGTRGQIAQIKHFASTGNYGLQIDLKNGSHRGEKVWVYLNTRNPGMELLDPQGAATARPERAKEAVTREEVPAIPEFSSAPAGGGLLREAAEAGSQLEARISQVVTPAAPPCHPAQAPQSACPGGGADRLVLAMLSLTEPDGSTSRWNVTNPSVLDAIRKEGGVCLGEQRSSLNLLPGGSALAAISEAYGRKFDAMENYRSKESAFKKSYFSAVNQIESAVAQRTGKSASEIEHQFSSQFGEGYVVLNDQNQPSSMIFDASLCLSGAEVSPLVHPPFDDHTCSKGRKIEALAGYDFNFDPSSGQINFKQRSAPRILEE